MANQRFGVIPSNLEGQGGSYLKVKEDESGFEFQKTEPIGDWIASYVYYVGDIVQDSLKVYRCKTQHTSTTSLATDIANWDELSAQADPLILAATSSTVGQIQQPSGTRLLHTYGVDNVFLGKNAGNFTLQTSTVQGHIGIGTNALNALPASGTVNGNVAIGLNAAQLLTTGGCIAIGKNALAQATTSSNNVVVGDSAGYSLSGSGSAGNVLVGYYCGYSLTSDKNVAIGESAFRSGSGTSTRNALIGYYAGYTTGNFYLEDSIVIGQSAAYGYKATIQKSICIGSECGYELYGNDQIAIGHRAMYRVGSSSARNIAIGSNSAGLNTAATATDGIFIGYQSGYHITSANYSVFIGSNSGYQNTSGEYNTHIGYRAGAAGAASTQNRNTSVGAYAGENTNTLTCAHNVSIGNNAGQYTYASYSVCIGSAAGNALRGDGSIAIGYQALDATSSGADRNTIIGYQAGTAITTGTGNTALGYRAGWQTTGDTDGTYLGNYAGYSNNGSTRMVCVGSRAGMNVTTSGGGAVIVGYNAAGGSSGGGHNVGASVIIGQNAVQTGAITCEGVYIGNGAKGGSGGTSNGCVCVGTSAGYRIASNNNVAVGSNALGNTNANFTGGNSVAVGESAGQQLTSGGENVFIGYRCGYGQDTGQYNILIGSLCGASGNNTQSSGVNNNVYIGYQVGYIGGGAVAGGNNVAIGYSAKLSSVAANSVCIGYSAGNALVGDGSIAIGYQTLDGTSSGADNNVAIGYQSGTAITTGANNTLLGDLSGSTIAAGTQNVCIGSNSQVNAAGDNNSIVIGYGTTGGGSNTAILGNSSITQTILRGSVCIGGASANSPLEIADSGSNKGIRVTSGSGAAALNLYTTDSTAGNRNWVIRNRYNAYGMLEFTRGANLGDDPSIVSLALDNSNNVLIGTTSTPSSASGVLAIANGTQGAATANMIQIASEDLSADNTIPSIRTEGSGITSAGVTNTTVTTKIALKINGTVYYLLATTSAS